MTPTYEYVALPLNLVLACQDRDAYLSDDRELQEYRRALAGGFRWIRSEEGYAIFERVKPHVAPPTGVK